MPCRGCRACQFRIGETGCVQQDDFTLLFDMICGADVGKPLVFMNEKKGSLVQRELSRRLP